MIVYKKFTEIDELCGRYLGLEAAQTTTLYFNNFLDDWESVVIYTINDVDFEKLIANTCILVSLTLMRTMTTTPKYTVW